MSKKELPQAPTVLSSENGHGGDHPHPSHWQHQLSNVAQRFNREYHRDGFDLPPEVEAMAIFQDWMSGSLQTQLTSSFWELTKPRKGDRCLDLGCGISFLIYPWREWNAFFYGQEISGIAKDILNSRGPQLNSKLFKGVVLAPAHELNYPTEQFDLVIATGFSCYYPLDYWQAVLKEVERVLKPEGTFIFDVLNPSLPLSENWAILETYLGAEVFLEPLPHWDSLLRGLNINIINQQSGELFHLYQVRL